MAQALVLDPTTNALVDTSSDFSHLYNSLSLPLLHLSGLIVHDYIHVLSELYQHGHT